MIEGSASPLHPLFNQDPTQVAKAVDVAKRFRLRIEPSHRFCFGLNYSKLYGQPIRRRGNEVHAMKWVTKEQVKVNKMARPWLIRRFFNRQADFLLRNEGLR